MLRFLGVVMIGIAVLAAVGASAARLDVDGGTIQVFSQSVDLETPDPQQITVPVDISPGSCPNPINTRSGGQLPVAIAGTADLDVTDIDPATVRLEGVAPQQWSIDDVATPYEPFTGKTAANDCTEDGGDGIDDLVLHFNTQDVVSALGALSDGDILTLSVTGEMHDGTAVEGEDVVVVIVPGGGGGPPGQQQPANAPDEDPEPSQTTIGTTDNAVEDEDTDDAGEPISEDSDADAASANEPGSDAGEEDDRATEEPTRTATADDSDEEQPQDTEKTPEPSSEPGDASDEDNPLTGEEVDEQEERQDDEDEAPEKDPAEDDPE